MSQKKHRKLRKEKEVIEVKNQIVPIISFRQMLKENWKFLAVLLGLTFGLFLNGMWGDFVSDDYATVLNNPHLGDLGQMMKYEMPGNLMNWSNFIIFLIFGKESPVPYHFFSLFCYLSFLVLAYYLLVILTKNKLISGLSMLIFAVMPIHVEAVSWNAGRVYLIISWLILACLITFIKFHNTGKTKYLIYTLVMWVFAFMSDRPRPFAFFLLIGLYMLIFGWGKVKEKKKEVMVFGGVALLILLFIGLPYITGRINIVNSGINASGGIFYNPIFQYPITITKYLQLLWAPTDLTLYHTMYVLPGWLNWAVMLLYIASLIYFFFKNKNYFWALCFIFLATFPSMTPVKVAWLVAERYMFLGSLGFALLLGLIFNDLSKYLKILAPVLALCLIIVYGIRTYLRNSDWRTNHSLWVSTCQVSPNSHNAWNNIGDDYDKLSDYGNAIKGFTQSTIVKPNYADAYHNRANIFYKIGRLDLARESYQTGLNFNPNLMQTYLSLTQIDLMERKLDLALIHASKAVELDSRNPQTLYVLGVVQAEVGNLTEARKILEFLVTNYPDYQPARAALDQLNKGVK